MTRGAIAAREIEQKEKERKSKEQIEANKLKDNEKQREFEKGENKKKNITNLVTGGLKMFKLAPKLNDPAYYKKFIKELDRYVNLPVYQRLGIEPWSPDFIAKGKAANRARVPGIMRIDWIPSIGYQSSSATQWQTPINQGLARTKEQILKSNSRSNVSYEGADIGLNLFCTADIFTLTLTIEQALRAYQTYKGDNAYLAKALITAMLVDYDDLVGNVADYRKRLIAIKTRINSSIVAPADISLYARRLYIAGNIFVDREGDKIKQIYFYHQVHYHALSNTGANTSVLEHNVPKTLNELFQYLELMISRIVDNPDFVEMYADLRSAVSNLISMDTNFGADDTLAFNYDENNRQQIHNIKTWPLIQYGDYESEIISSHWHIGIDSNGYLYQGSSSPGDRDILVPQGSGMSEAQIKNIGAWLELNFTRAALSNDNVKDKHLFDCFGTKEITGDDMLEITRGTFTIQRPILSGGYLYCVIEDSSSEFFTGYKIYTIEENDTLHKYDGSTHMLSITSSTTDGPIPQDFAYFVALYTKFDWAPMTTCYKLTTNSEAVTNLRNAEVQFANVSDLDQSFTISDNDLLQLNQACILSECYLDTGEFKR